MPTQAILEVTHYETQVHLGWTDEERATPQKIALDITLRYAKLPEACISDELNDTQCYAQLIEWVEKICQSKAFKLLEHLAYQVHKTLKDQINNPTTRLFIRVHKLNPPVVALKDASFSISEDMS